MRLAYPAPIALVNPTTHPLQFTGPHGELFQITVLEEGMIRVQHFPEGRPRLDRTWMVVGADGDVPREGRRRDDLSPFSLPAFTLETESLVTRLRTTQLSLEIDVNAGRLRWADATGRAFAADLIGRAYAYDRASKAIFHYMERHPDEHYYGFGECSGPLDKAGRRIRLRPLDTLGYNAETGDPLYKHFPFYITFVPERQIAYGLFYDNLAAATFDMGQEIDAYHGPYRYYQADDGDIDYYFIYGPSVEQVIEKYTRLTGRMSLPPRWSLGYLASTMAYTEAPDAQAQLKLFIELCAEHRIPCDLFHLSSGYTADPDGQRYVFNWNRDRIPDPQAMADDFHRAGIKLAANIKPCLLTTNPRYAEVAVLGGFVRAAETDAPEVNAFWGGPGSYIDFTSPAGYDWWKARVTDQLLVYGINTTWNDNNEYEIWDDAARCHGFGEALPIGLVRPVQTLLMARASREAQRAFRPDERPFVISRSGCPGIQRYAQTWSGDNTTSWHTLRYNIPMGLSLSLCGAPNTGHDVGGFFGHRPDPELFVRWVENGIFHPRFNIHSWHLDGSVNEPWMYPEVLPIIREAIEFRYRLIPYLYSLFFEAAHTSRPIIRPMVYAFADDPQCHTESFDFMLGPNLLVASVIEPGARTRAVYLPAGHEWCDFHTGQWHEGGQTLLADAPLDRIPLFVPAGGIAPMGKVMRYVGEQPDDLRQALVFPHPHGGRGAFTLIEDDGLTFGYRRGEYTTVALEVAAEPEHITLSAKAQGLYPLPYGEIEFILPPGEARPARADGPCKTWRDPLGRQHLSLQLPPTDH